jgi:hypothetical protein
MLIKNIFWLSIGKTMSFDFIKKLIKLIKEKLLRMALTNLKSNPTLFHLQEFLKPKINIDNTKSNSKIKE